MKVIALILSLVFAMPCGAWTLRVEQSVVPTISLNTGHSLGDMVACYVLEDSATTGAGTSVLDLTSNDYDLTLSGGYTRETNGISFDGIDGIASGAHTPISAYAFTIVAVFKTPASTADLVFAGGIAKSTQAGGFFYVGAKIDTNYNPVVIANNGTWERIYGSSTLSTTTTYAVAGVYVDATDRELFMDGSSEGTDTTSVTVASLLDRVTIGATGDSSITYGKGIVYAVYIFDRALSDSDAQSITSDPYQMINNYSGP